MISCTALPWNLKSGSLWCVAVKRFKTERWVFYCSKITLIIHPVMDYTISFILISPGFYAWQNLIFKFKAVCVLTTLGDG